MTSEGKLTVKAERHRRNEVKLRHLWWNVDVEKNRLWRKTRQGETQLEFSVVTDDEWKTIKWIPNAKAEDVAKYRALTPAEHQYFRLVPAEPSEADVATVVKQELEAASQGSPRAQSDLGSRYDLGGLGVPRDLAMAVKWYHAAAEQGDLWAQYRLGQIYADGSGVERNISKALMWTEKAAAQGMEEAEGMLASISGCQKEWACPTRASELESEHGSERPKNSPPDANGARPKVSKAFGLGGCLAWCIVGALVIALFQATHGMILLVLPLVFLAGGGLGVAESVFGPNPSKVQIGIGMVLLVLVIIGICALVPAGCHSAEDFEPNGNFRPR